MLQGQRRRQIRLLAKLVIARTFRSSRSPRGGWLRWPSTFGIAALSVAPLTLGVMFFSGILMLFGAIEQENSNALSGYFRSLTFTGALSVTGNDTEVYNSVLPVKQVKDVQAALGDQAAPVSVFYTRFGSQDVLYVGIKPRSLATPAIYQGRMFANDTEVVIDRYLAQDLHLRLGQQVVMHDRKVTVVGLSDLTDAISRRRIFVNPGLYAQMSGTNAVNFVLINEQFSVAPKSGVQVFSRQAWLDGAVNYGKRNVTPLVDASAGFTTAGLVAACAAFSAFMQFLAKRQMMLMRTQGMGRAQLITVEMVSMFIQIVLGFVLGIAFGELGIWYTVQTTPGFHGGINPLVVMFAAIWVFPATLVPGLVPIWLTVRTIKLADALRV